MYNSIKTWQTSSKKQLIGLQQSETTLYNEQWTYSPDTSNNITNNSFILWHCINRKRNNKMINKFTNTNPHLQ